MSGEDLGALYEADEDIQSICESVKKAAEDQVSKTFCCFNAICYKSKPVAGTSYYIKVCVGDGGEHVHLNVHQAVKGNYGDLWLVALEEGKSGDDPIEIF